MGAEAHVKERRAESNSIAGVLDLSDNLTLLTTHTRENSMRIERADLVDLFEVLRELFLEDNHLESAMQASRVAYLKAKMQQDPGTTTDQLIYTTIAVERLIPFIQHKDDCDFVQPMWHQGLCDCGLHKLVRSLPDNEATAAIKAAFKKKLPPAEDDDE